MTEKVIVSEPLRCAQCGLPFARLQGGTLIIESKHRGRVHVNVIAVSELAKMVEDDHQSNGGLDRNGS